MDLSKKIILFFIAFILLIDIGLLIYMTIQYRNYKKQNEKQNI